MAEAYAVKVTYNGKETLKEFQTEKDFKAFVDKAEEMKKKAKGLLVQVINQPPIRDEGKDQCMAWEPTDKVDSFGRVIYRCVPVHQKGGKNTFYCPHCHGYKNWAKVDYGYDLEVKGCPECEMSESDFYIKTANSLWRMK